jgi:hypothetical protein
MRWIFGTLILLVCGGCADSWLLYPSTQPIDAGGAERRIFTYNARRIEVFIARSPGVRSGTQPQAYSLEFTGNSTRAEQVANQSARMWGARPVEVWVMNYPGFGKSEGAASLGLIPQASLATYDLLRQSSDGKPIILKGYSLGTTAALCVAARRPCAGMILQSPPPLQREIIQEYGWWNLWMAASITVLEIPEELNSLTNAPKIGAPAIFNIAGRDALVPPQYQMMVVDKYGGPKLCRIRSGAAHNTLILPGDRKLQQDLDWLWANGMNP